jgi:hypothetical protein
MLQSRGGGMDKEIFITTLQVCLFEAPDWAIKEIYIFIFIYFLLHVCPRMRSVAATLS